MMFYRPVSLLSILICVFVWLAGSAAQGGQQSSTQQPAQSQQQPPPQQPRKPNPFENVPTAPAQPAPEQPKPQQPANKLETVPQAKPVQPGAAPPQDIVEDITFRGSR